MKLSLRSLHVVAILLILAAALFLRLAPISSENVDGDELFSRRVALSETSQALNLVKQDLVHPPLYYLLLKMTLPNGRSASVLDIRVLSLTAGTASIMVLILIGFAAPPLRGPSILAAFLLALNKIHIFYNQQARSYALFCLLVGALLLWAVLMDRQGQKWAYWLAGTALMAALLYIHYFGAFYCAAVVLPVVLGKCPKRFKIKAAGSLAVAFAGFLPWAYQEIVVYREKSGLSSNLAWQGVPTLFDLKMTFANFLGIPNFRGATSLAFLIGTVLICSAMLPKLQKESDILDSRTRTTLALMALMPPSMAFILTGWPFQIPIFGERHVLPSILAALLLVCYGLWRLTLCTSKRLRVPVLVIGVIVLSAFQALPVWDDWPGPSRQPYAAIADRLRHRDLDLAVYTTWPYGIGEPVAFYLEGSRRINGFPANPAMLPDKCILLYRPAVTREDAAANSLLQRFDITEDIYYSARNSRWGTRLLVLQKRQEGGYHLVKQFDATQDGISVGSGSFPETMLRR